MKTFGDPELNDSIARELLSVTQDAVASARIDHRTRTQELLDRRDQLLAKLWGFEPSSPLPNFEDKGNNDVVPALTDVGKMMLRDVNKLNNKLLTYLQANQGRLLEEDRFLRRGEKVISGLRSLFDANRKEGKRLDMRG